jgi:hypothetical protein
MFVSRLRNATRYATALIVKRRSLEERFGRVEQVCGSPTDLNERFGGDWVQEAATDNALISPRGKTAALVRLRK